jgi:NDP-hexose-3-ketoreductase
MVTPAGTGPSSTGPASTGPGAGVRLGVLGCASIARGKLLPAVRRLPSIRVAAIASRRLATAQAAAAQFGGEAVEGYQALLDRDDVEAVYIPLPTGLHVEWARRALEAGKHVLCEKPMTTSAADTAELVTMASSQGLVLMENFMFLYHAQHAAVRQLIAEGAIGDVRTFTAVFGFPPLPRTDIRYRSDLGGGALLDAGVYPLRAAQYFLGPELTLLGACLQADPATGVDVGGSALLARRNGASVHVAFGFQHGYRCRYEIWGSAGRITVDRAFTPPDAWRPVIRIDRHGHQEDRTLPADDQFRNVAGAFAGAIRSGQPPEMVSGQPPIDLAILVDQIRAAAARYRSGTDE